MTLALVVASVAVAAVAQVGTRSSEQFSAQAEAQRASARAAALDREAQAATEASERATLAAAALAARVEEAAASLANADEELMKVRDQRLALDRELARERAPVARLLAGLQTQVRRPPMLTLFQAGSVQDAVHLRAVLAALTPQVAARTTSVRRSLARAQALEANASAIAAQRRNLQAELANRRTELATVSAAERLKARRAAGAADREAERAYALARQLRSPATLANRLDTARPGGRRSASASGPTPYRLPVAGAQLGRAGGEEMQMKVRPGALVVAPGAGRVAFAGPFRGFATIVIIEHANGWTSLVTGLAASQVAVGQEVVAGSPIGEAQRTNPVVGLELRRNGRRVDPLDQLR